MLNWRNTDEVLPGVQALTCSVSNPGLKLLYLCLDPDPQKLLVALEQLKFSSLMTKLLVFLALLLWLPALLLSMDIITQSLASSRLHVAIIVPLSLSQKN